MVAGDDEAGDACRLDAAQLPDQVPDRVPRRPRVVEEIPGVEHDVRTLVDDRRQCRLEGTLSVDQPLVPTVFVMTAGTAVAEVGVGEVRDAERCPHRLASSNLPRTAGQVLSRELGCMIANWLMILSSFSRGTPSAASRTSRNCGKFGECSPISRFRLA